MRQTEIFWVFETTCRFVSPNCAELGFVVAIGSKSRCDLCLVTEKICCDFLKPLKRIMVGFKIRFMIVEVFLDLNRDLAGHDPIVIAQFNGSKTAFLYTLESEVLLHHLDPSNYVNPTTKLCIIKASREEYQKVWSAITMVRSIGNCPVLFNLLDLSGSIKACRNIALKYDELKFEQYKLVVEACLAIDAIQHMQSCLDKIKVLEH
ncbi:putative ribonuclease p/mrp protein subunit pop5 [Quercus suber]|uniref:Ribonuclease p/mrp protein subunit pop5 n=1 Tax=Quercus suber TaxID=58331 RepID=A0AAW0KHA8_QUESU